MEQIHTRSALESHVMEWLCPVDGTHTIVPTRPNLRDQALASPPRCQCGNLMQVFNRKEATKEVAEATKEEVAEAKDRRKTLGLDEHGHTKESRQAEAERLKKIAGSKTGVHKPRNQKPTASKKPATKKPAVAKTKAAASHRHTIAIKGEVK